MAVKGHGFVRVQGTEQYVKDPVLLSRVHDELNGNLNITINIDVDMYSGGKLVLSSGIQNVKISDLEKFETDKEQTPRRQYINQIDKYVAKHFEDSQIDCQFSVVSVEQLKETEFKPATPSEE